MESFKVGIFTIIFLIMAYLIVMSCFRYSEIKEVRENYIKILKGDSKESVLELIGKPLAYKIKDDSIAIWKYRINNNIFYVRQFRVRFKGNNVDTTYLIED